MAKRSLTEHDRLKQETLKSPVARAEYEAFKLELELAEQLKRFAATGKILEAERLKRRTRQDISMIREFGFCNGIENHSRHFDRRNPGEPPYTLLSYFPRKANGTPDFLTVIDESHVTVPQTGGMYAGDRARKETLVEHGFRLPSCVDNRPLMFEEFEKRVGQTLYTSATPGRYELERSGAPTCPAHSSFIGGKNLRHPTNIKSLMTAKHVSECAVVEQVIRPTGLVDPEIIVRPIISSDGPRADDNKHKLRKFVNTDLRSPYLGQVKDFIAEAEIVTKRGGRSMVTVLTKKMAEDLTSFLVEKKIKARYVHSDVKTIERIEILTDFRKGTFDVLVGVNLLREGLDLPEVELVGILDADKEGFLRSDTSLIQTIGRAARNVLGRVILYADMVTGSMKRAIGETERRRVRQVAYNKEHGITPQTIRTRIKDIVGDIERTRKRAVSELAEHDKTAYAGDKKKLVAEKRREMHDAADKLDFETAALLRDELRVLEGTGKKSK